MEMGTDMASSDNDAEMIRECEQYVEQNNIQSILKDAIVQLCVAKPTNPFRFLREHFEKLEKVSIIAMFCTVQSVLFSKIIAFYQKFCSSCHFCVIARMIASP